MGSVAVYSPKGGVGKSTCAVNLSYASAVTSKRRSLLWDIDAQGAAGFLVGAKQQPRQPAQLIFSRDAEATELAQQTSYPLLSVILSDHSLRRLETQLVEEDARKRVRKVVRGLQPAFERIVIDCPPGVTEISEQIFRAVDLIVIPVPPSPLGVRAFEEATAHLRSMRRGAPELLPVFSMVDGRRKLHQELLAAHPDWGVIPYASAIEQMSAVRAPLATFAPRHPAARAYADLWRDVEARLAQL